MLTRSEDRTEVFEEVKAPSSGLEWLSRLKAFDGLFRKLILWAFLLCVLGVIATNTMAVPAR